MLNKNIHILFLTVFITIIFSNNSFSAVNNFFCTKQQAADWIIPIYGGMSGVTILVVGNKYFAYVGDVENGNYAASAGFCLDAACWAARNCPGEFVAPDSDGDGIADKYDLYPDDSTVYRAGIKSFLYNNTTGEIVAGIIIDSNGNEFSFGTVPGESEIDGFSSEIIDGQVTLDTAEELQSTLENLIGDVKIEPLKNHVEINDDGQFDDFVKGTKSLPKLIEDKIESPEPLPTLDPGLFNGEKSTPNDTDNTALKKIADNTGITADNLKRLADYLKTNNDILSQISKKTGKGGGVAIIPGTSGDYKGPTADEIGQSVKDKLEDSTNTYDSTTTDNIDGFIIDTGTMEGIGTKYSNRVTSFTDTLKNSDLFSLSSNLFSPPTSTTSEKTFSIGSWGGSSNNQVSIDMSDYNSIWSVLRGIILIMASYAAFKIVVTKHA